MKWLVSFINIPESYFSKVVDLIMNQIQTSLSEESPPVELGGGGGISCVDATEGVVDVGDTSDRDAAFEIGAGGGTCPWLVPVTPPPWDTVMSGPAGW